MSDFLNGSQEIHQNENPVPVCITAKSDQAEPAQEVASKQLAGIHQLKHYTTLQKSKHAQNFSLILKPARPECPLSALLTALSLQSTVAASKLPRGNNLHSVLSPK